MIDIPGDLVWDLLCVQQASYLEGGGGGGSGGVGAEVGGTDVDVAPGLQVNQKTDDDDDDGCWKGRNRMMMMMMVVEKAVKP